MAIFNHLVRLTDTGYNDPQAKAVSFKVTTKEGEEIDVFWTADARNANRNQTLGKIYEGAADGVAVFDEAKPFETILDRIGMGLGAVVGALAYGVIAIGKNQIGDGIFRFGQAAFERVKLSDLAEGQNLDRRDYTVDTFPHEAS